MEITQTNMKEKKRIKRTEQKIQELQDNIEQCKIYVTGILKEKKNEQAEKKYLKKWPKFS